MVFIQTAFVWTYNQLLRTKTILRPLKCVCNAIIQIALCRSTDRAVKYDKITRIVFIMLTLSCDEELYDRWNIKYILYMLRNIKFWQTFFPLVVLRSPAPQPPSPLPLLPVYNKIKMAAMQCVSPTADLFVFQSGLMENSFINPRTWFLLWSFFFSFLYTMWPKVCGRQTITSPVCLWWTSCSAIIPPLLL